MHVEPQAPRYQIENTLDGLRAVIPAQRNWLVVLFLTAWMGGWVVGETHVAIELMNPKAAASYAFLLCWFVGWTLGGGMVIGSLLWQFAGREIVTVNASALLHRVEVFGLGRNRSYRATDVKGLRAVDMPVSDERQQSWFPPFAGSGRGPIAFDYGARTIRLGSSLEEAEARLLVGMLVARLPGQGFPA